MYQKKNKLSLNLLIFATIVAVVSAVGWQDFERSQRTALEVKFGSPKIGLLDETGTIIVPAHFSYISRFKGGYAQACEWYLNPGPCSGGGQPECFAIRKDGSVVVKLNDIIAKLEHEKTVHSYSAIETADGCFITTPNFDKVAGPFDECLAMSADMVIVKNQGSLYLLIPGEIHKKLEHCTDAKCGSSSRFMAVKTSTGWGVINRLGEYVVPSRYNAVELKADGFVRVLELNDDNIGSWALVDLDSKLGAKTPFYTVGNTLSGYLPAAVKVKGLVKWGIIDTSRNWVLQPEYQNLELHENGLAIIHDRGNTAKLFTINKRTFGRNFRTLRYLGCNLFAFQLNDSEQQGYGLINAAGMVVKEPCFSYISYIGSNLFAFQAMNSRDKNYGIINVEGAIVTKPVFSAVSAINPFIDSTKLWPASVILNGRECWGWIDQFGNWKIEPMYASAGPFSEGVACFGITPKITGTH